MGASRVTGLKLDHFPYDVLDRDSLDAFDASSDQAAAQLADAEIKISYAVLDYARDARGGRIEPARPPSL